MRMFRRRTGYESLLSDIKRNIVPLFLCQEDREPFGRLQRMDLD